MLHTLLAGQNYLPLVISVTGITSFPVKINRENWQGGNINGECIDKVCGYADDNVFNLQPELGTELPSR